ncbi:MAG: ABC transporter permease subunit [Caldicoprobacter sp.]|uniref:ABC transporter permease subunit n=1 Tax=Caldicoprobacter sp. TaxID=2004500 RepID=UPI0039C3B7A4
MNANKNSNNKKPSFLYLLFTKLFGGKKQLSLLEEEQMESPFRIVINNFRDNKVAMTGLIVFILIFIFVMVGPYFFPIDLSFAETSQQNVPPGFDLMKVPKELQGKIQQISIGPTFSVGISTDGKIYVWGKTKVTKAIDVKNMPKNMGKIVKVAAGYDHILAMNDKGQLFAWGSNRNGQANIPPEVAKLDNIVDIKAGYQCSMVLTADGYTYFFGNSMNNDYNPNHKYQGQIAQIELTSDAVVGLTFDGQVVYLGYQQNSYSNIPENMGKVVDIATTASTIAAVNEEGRVFVWGNVTKGEGDVPHTESKIVDIQGGRYHYSAITEDGKVVAWGANYYKQASVPKKLQQLEVTKLFTGYYQNYAVTKDGKLITWGLKGYPLGTDDLGRDILTRLVHGGFMTMTVGAIAVIISTIIGVIIGSISGYFGGRTDMILQRVTEMISSLPFLPFVMILSALIGNSMDTNQKIMLIMVILGLLSWPGLSRLVRAQVLSVREQEYVTAARAMGVKQINIVFKHILPNVISVILVSATLDFATCMLIEATLSFLGFGVPAPYPTWGNMLYGSNNSTVIQNYWWRWVFPSIILGICVICINVIGDGLRDAIDPRTQER